MGVSVIIAFRMEKKLPILNPVKSILVSQPKPENPKNPYQELAEKYKVKIDFRQFMQVIGVSAKDFRKQRIDILNYTSVIFTSRNAIDHFFRLCEDLRIKIPEMIKYFCVTEAIAVYLQKYIQYRKRKVFYGSTGKETELFDLLKKHLPTEKFLFPCATNHKDNITEFLRAQQANFTEAYIYETTPANMLDMMGKIEYDMIILFTPTGVQSLFQNFPKFKKTDLRIGGVGFATHKAMEENKIHIDLKAPTPESPSIIMALEKYLSVSNKRGASQKKTVK